MYYVVDEIVSYFMTAKYDKTKKTRFRTISSYEKKNVLKIKYCLVVSFFLDSNTYIHYLCKSGKTRLPPAR